MSSAQAFFGRAAVHLTLGAAVTILFSIAVSQSLMALALAALLLSGEQLRFPPLKLPLGLFALGTVVALAFSGNPAAGRPQIRKFFIFVILLLVASALREVKHIRRMWAGWAILATGSAALGIWQFFDKWRDAGELGREFYTYYVGERITGMMSHWQTFGGQMMIAWLTLAAFVLFAPEARRRLTRPQAASSSVGDTPEAGAESQQHCNGGGRVARLK